MYRKKNKSGKRDEAGPMHVTAAILCHGVLAPGEPAFYNQFLMNPLVKEVIIFVLSSSTIFSEVKITICTPKRDICKKT